MDAIRQFWLLRDFQRSPSASQCAGLYQAGYFTRETPRSASAQLPSSITVSVDSIWDAILSMLNIFKLGLCLWWYREEWWVICLWGQKCRKSNLIITLKKKQQNPPKQWKPQGSQVKKKKSHTNLSSFLQSFQGGWAPSCKRVDSKGDLHWHCCQAHFLLKFYSSLTNVFLSQLWVILMQAATGKGSPILPSREFSPPLLCQHQHFCADETQPDKEKKNQPIN